VWARTARQYLSQATLVNFGRQTMRVFGMGSEEKATPQRTSPEASSKPTAERGRSGEAKQESEFLDCDVCGRTGKRSAASARNDDL
jgi:hypothetical protein